MNLYGKILTNLWFVHLLLNNMSENAEIQITANGESYTIPAESSLIAFLESKELSIKRVVVEYNDNPLSPSEASDIVLQNGDKLEIVRIVAGG